MQVTILQGKTGKAAFIASEGFLLASAENALDLIGDIRYNHHCEAVLLHQKNIAPAFFDLKTGLAGEILQKFTNYRMRIGIIGDFSCVESKSLHDFIYECNQGSQIVFKSTVEEILEVL